MKPQTREALVKLKKRLIDDTLGTPLEDESRALYEEIERQLESAVIIPDREFSRALSNLAKREHQ
jgi:hypothetical protein